MAIASRKAQKPIDMSKTNAKEKKKNQQGEPLSNS